MEPPQHTFNTDLHFGAKNDASAARKKLVKRLHELRQRKLTRDQLLIKLGGAKKEAGSAVWRIIDITLPEKDQPAVTEATFHFRLNRPKLCQACLREGSYLLRPNLTERDPVQLWSFYLQPVEMEQAFKELKGDLAQTFLLQH